MSLFDVCRLCSSKNNLVWVFNRENKTDILMMEEIIFVTTGVEIHKKDMVSQKICDKCTQFTSTMFSFRKKCEENDKKLKDMCMQLLKITDMRIPNTDVTIKHEKNTKDKSKEEHAKAPHKVHPTIVDLFRTYPKLKLPTPCLKQDVAPFVSMPLDEVENYFKSHNLNYDEPIKFALEPEEVDDKELANIDCDSGPTTSDLVINAKIISDKNENEDNDIIRPIKIKIFSLDCANKKIGDGVDASVKNLNNNHNYNEGTSNIGVRTSSTNHLNVPEHARLHRKRKFSDINESPETDKVHTSPISNIEKSDPSHICDIYNSVYYKFKDLKHQFDTKHCEFCNMKFLNLETKLLHLEKCIIKKAIENLPNVEAQKIEYNIEIRRKYPTAFSDFPALENDPIVINNGYKDLKSLRIVGRSSSASINSLKAKKSKASLQCAKLPVTAEDTVDVIDISSDDDDDDEILIIEPTSTETRTSNTILEKKISNQVAAIPVAGVVNNIPTASNEIITPNIEIKNTSILNNVNVKMSDVEILRKLLIGKSLKLFAETSTQTYFPRTRSIRIRSDQCAELKNLKRTLYAHKIPVVIKPGPFSVLYNYKINCSKPKKLHLWNDLPPIDIKTKKKKIIIHQNIIQSNSKRSNYIPTSKPLSVNNNVVSNSLESIGDTISLVDNFEPQNSSTSKPPAITTRPSSVPSRANSFVSSVVTGLQQDVHQYSPTSKSQATITMPCPVSAHRNSFVSHITRPQQAVRQYSPRLKPQAITTPSPVSLHTNSFVSNITQPQQYPHQYSSTSKPQVITTPRPVSSHTNSFVSNMLPQQNIHQYSATLKPQAIATPSSVSSHYQYPKSQEIITTPIPLSTYTCSSVSNISDSQQSVTRYSSTFETQAVVTTSIPASTCTTSSVSNISDSQQGVYQCSSTSEPQEITIASILASTCTSSSASNISVTQQGVYQYPSTSASQDFITTSIASSTCTNSFVSNISDSQQGVYQYSSTSEPQEFITTSFASPTRTNSLVSDISDSQQGVYQYSSTSESQEVITTTSIPTSTCTSSSASNTSVPQQDVYQYSFSEPQEVITTSIPSSTCTSSSSSNISVSQPAINQYSSTSKPQEVTTASITASRCTSSSSSNISVSQPGVYQYSSTSEPQEVTTTSITASRCTSSSSSNISVSQPGVYQYPSPSKPQEVVAATVLASTALSVSNAVPQQDVYQSPSTSESQGVTSAPTSALTCTIPSVSNISATQQNGYQYFSTSESQGVNSSVPFGSAPPQGFIRLKDMSELI